jgi:glycolate oxidase FAD binding subunit
MTITVEAGLTIAALNECLATQKQRLPVNVACADRATVGGIVAVNAFGPRRYAYGTLRDYVLGFTAIDGNGMIFSGGGRVVKNAAGYNMPRLITGSFGTLGVLTQVTLMVRPLPETSAMLACEVADFEAAERLLAALIHSNAKPAAIEFLTGPQQKAEGESDLFGPMTEGMAGRLCVGLEGPEAEVNWMVDQLKQEWTAAGVTPLTLLFNPHTEQPWRQLAEWSAGAEFLAEINVLPSAVMATIAELAKRIPQATFQAHAGNGVILVGMKTTGQEASNGKATFSERELLSIAQQMRDIAVTAGGSLVIRKRPENTAWTAADVWGPAGSAVTVMQAIKDRFDPKNLLNSGRFIFG